MNVNTVLLNYYIVPNIYNYIVFQIDAFTREIPIDGFDHFLCSFQRCVACLSRTYSFCCT